MNDRVYTRHSWHIPMTRIRVDWHRYIHHYASGDRRYVNQWHIIRDARSTR